VRQEKGREVIGGEGPLDPIDGQLAAGGSRARVVDQDIDRAESIMQPSGELADRGLAREVGGQEGGERAGRELGHGRERLAAAG